MCPKEFGAMGGVLGLKYEAMKDYVRWATPPQYDYEEVQKTYIPMLHTLGQVFASTINPSTKKSDPF